MTLEERNKALDEAKELILAGWCQGAFAKDKDQKVVNRNDPQATCFCVMGACLRVQQGSVSLLPYLTKANKEYIGGDTNGDLVRYNDNHSRTKYEVTALFDHAKELPL